MPHALGDSVGSMTSVQQSALAAYLREFHEHVGAAMRDVPTADVPGAQRRLDFIDEEAQELRDAIEAQAIVEIADALGDLAYLVYGTALHFGIDLDRVVAEVHRSNMTKSPAGEAKSIKGPGYEPPDLTWIVDRGRAQ